MAVIFDLDQTIIDSNNAYDARRRNDWKLVYSMIPSMQPYRQVVNLINDLIFIGEKVAIVTSSPRPYCQKILDYIGVIGAITVCYHDTLRHKPEADPYLKAIEEMNVGENEPIFVVGDEKEDIIAAELINAIGILVYWSNHFTYWGWNESIMPYLFCRDEECLIRFFHSLDLGLGTLGLRERTNGIYQLFDYYPYSRVHDYLSECILNEVKENNDETNICEEFCKALESQNIRIPYTYGIFVVPSSTAQKWNYKLVNYVVPRLINNMGLINCSQYIMRRTTHEKQAFGGDRSILSNLKTICLQRPLPSNIQGALIIDDITTTGNVFEACRQLLFKAGIKRENMICAAIGGTVN